MTNIQTKPENYKTVKQWEKLGFKPKDENCIKEYIAVKHNGEIAYDENGNLAVYKYVSPDDVVKIAHEAFKFLASHDSTKEEVQKEKKQETKASQKFEFPKDGEVIICLDIETTGFSPRHWENGELKGFDELLQVSIVDEEKEILNQYIKPQFKKSWEQAEKVNHISPAKVSFAPYAKDVKDKIQKIIDGADIIVGHNISFDTNFLEKYSGISFEGKKIFDTLAYFKKDEPHLSHKLEKAVEHYCPDFLQEYQSGAHDSLVDTKATIKVYRAIVEKERKKERDLLELSKDIDRVLQVDKGILCLQVDCQGMPNSHLLKAVVQKYPKVKEAIEKDYKSYKGLQYGKYTLVPVSKDLSIALVYSKTNSKGIVMVNKEMCGANIAHICKKNPTQKVVVPYVREEKEEWSFVKKALDRVYETNLACLDSKTGEIFPFADIQKGIVNVEATPENEKTAAVREIEEHNLF